MTDATDRRPEDAPRPLPQLWVPGFLKRPLLRKGLVLALLMLLFLLPVELLRGLVQERQWRQQEVVNEIGRLWGPEQTLVGPLLAVPVAEPSGRRGLVLLLPETLSVSGSLAPEVRRRGLFEALVYESALEVEARFRPPGAESFGLQPRQLLWEEARLLVAASDLSGLAGAVPVAVSTEAGAGPQGAAPGAAGQGSAETRLRPGRLLSLPGALEAPLPGIVPGRGLAVRFALTLDGSNAFAVAPVGETSEIALASSWPHPSFGGAGLPSESEIGPAGFAAAWQGSSFAEGLPAALRLGAGELAGDPLWGLRQAALGVTLMEPVDAYLMSERAVKYALFVVALVFAAVFLFEATSGRPLHPVQYLLVGAAETLFYLLLLSLSEAIGFGLAYLAAAAATVVLIALYLGRALGSRARALALAGGLAAVKLYLYVTLASEDFALLSGSLALFLLLATLMLATRKVEWYAARPS